MKTRSATLRKEEPIPVSIPCFKVNGKIDKEARDKRIGLSENRMRELETSSRAFFQRMCRQYGEIFHLQWQGRNTNRLGFHMKPESRNNSMWFLFTNGLRESLQNSGETTQGHFWWRVKWNNKNLCRTFLPVELFEWRGNNS